MSSFFAFVKKVIYFISRDKKHLNTSTIYIYMYIYIYIYIYDISYASYEVMCMQYTVKIGS